MIKHLVVFAILSLALANAAKNYSGYQVFQTTKLSPSAAKKLNALMIESDKFDFWKDPQPGLVSEIMAAPEDIPELIGILNNANVKFSIKISDVQGLIESNKMRKGRKLPKINPELRYNLNWDDYYSHDDINQFIDELAATYDFVSTSSIGLSYERRDMRQISITKAGAGAPNIFIEAGIHAREWISPAVATYLIRELVENNEVNLYADKVNIYAVPMANPDGYEYTRSDDRLWRKNRADLGSTLGCLGVDLNRNWGYHWGESGVSSNKCSNIYLGPESFSELETQNVRDFFNKVSESGTPELAICYHSAAELLLCPYGYASATYPDNYQDLFNLCLESEAALNAVHNQTFECIHSAELYPAAGASDDWYKSEGATYVYTPELRDNGYGFQLPADLIIPSGEEMWEHLKVLLDQVIKENGGKK